MISIPADTLAITLRVVVGVGGLYFAVCALLWAVQDGMIFYPQPLATRPAHPAATAIEIDRGDALLRGWLVNEDHAGPLIVYFGGNGEEVSGSIHNWAARDATTVLLNYRGYGESTGKPSERALVADALSVVAWARARQPGRRLVLFGYSLGSGVAALAGAEVAPDAMILLSPFRSVESIARRRFPYLPVRWLLRHPFRAEDVAAQLPATLVVASPGDRVIPFEESTAMVAALGEDAQFHTLDLAHGEFTTHAPFWRLVDDFLIEHQLTESV